MAIPLVAAYIDNVRLIKNDTSIVRGNRVSDCVGANVTAYKLNNCTNLLAKDNRAVRIKSRTKSSIAFHIYNCTTVTLLYSVASRVNTGFYLNSIDTLNVYNLTAHNTNRAVYTAASGIFRNVAFSNSVEAATYKVGTGFSVVAGYTVDLDYVYYAGLDELVASGTVIRGLTITEDSILYLDEPNDDLTPDYLSILNNTGTNNPLRVSSPDIGGIESTITDEITADSKYIYQLIDNSFWDIDTKLSGEMSLVTAMQSRVIAAAENDERDILRDLHIKTANSVTRFAELYPVNARYANQSKYKKRTMDLWYGSQNPATLTSYNAAIGGYNLFPSFYKRMEDYEDGWIIGQSYLNYDNWLNSYAGLKYGIFIDVLGVSTMNQATSGECYNNTMNSIADVAPVRWFLHEEVQPPNYYMFTDLYNGFENCTLTNMRYNNDFNIEIDVTAQAGVTLTPMIPTATSAASGISTEGLAPTGNVEISLLDRVFSENIDRDLYYRQGDDTAQMSSWSQILYPIGGNFSLSSKYVQFRIDVSGILRHIDYEFMGLCLRPYERVRNFTLPSSAVSTYIELMPGAALLDATNPPSTDNTQLVYPADGVYRSAGWNFYLPDLLVAQDSQVMRLVFAGNNFAAAGTAIIVNKFYTRDTNGVLISADVSVSTQVNISVGGMSYIDVDFSSVVFPDSEYLYFEIGRDSSAVGDTLNDNVLFFSGRSL